MNGRRDAPSDGGSETATYTCWCGVTSTWEISGTPQARAFRIVSHESSFVCAHWRDVHDAISDIADGLDPHARCRDGCWCSPCIGGNGPMSCEMLSGDDPRWAVLEREREAAGFVDVVLGDVVRRS